jgi:hypothetical protein
MSASVSRASAIRPRAAVRGQAEYSTSRFSGNSVRNGSGGGHRLAEAACLDQAADPLHLEFHAGGAATGCEVTVMASSKKKGRTLLSALGIVPQPLRSR